MSSIAFIFTVMASYLLCGGYNYRCIAFSSNNPMKSLLTVFLLILSFASQATLITLDLDKYDQFDFLDEDLNDGDQAIAESVVLTFSNIITSDGSLIGEIGGNGLYFSRDDDDNELISVDLMFNVDVRLIGIDIDRDNNLQAGEFWFEDGFNQSGNMLGVVGDVDYIAGDIPVFTANTVYTLRHNITNDDFFQIDELILEVVDVPEPSSALLMMMFLLGFMRIARKRN